MSRFFGVGSESDDDPVSTEDLVGGQGNSDKETAVPSGQAPQTLVKRQAQGQNDKRFDDIHAGIRGIRNAQKISDWVTISADFDKLTKAATKLSMVFDREGIPNFFIRFLAEMEDFVRTVQDSKDAKRKLSAANTKAMTNLKPKLKKYLKSFESVIGEYRTHPASFLDAEAAIAADTAALKQAKEAASSEESDSESDVDSSDEEASDDQDGFVTTTKKPTVKPASTVAKKPISAVADEDDWGSESDWSSGDEEVSENDDRQVYVSDDEDEEDEDDDDFSDEGDEGEKTGPRKKGLAKWGLRRAPAVSRAPVVPKAPRRQPAVRVDEEAIQAAQRAQRIAAENAAKAFELTPENVIKKVREINDLRGKKGVDRAEQLAILRKLLEIARGSLNQTVHVLMTVIPLQFDFYSPLTAATAAMTTSVLPMDAWKTIEQDLTSLLDLLQANLSAATSMMILQPETEAEEHEVSTSSNALPRILPGSLVSFIERLDDEFTKSIQLIDPHSGDYVDRLRLELPLYKLIVRAQTLFEAICHLPSVWRLVLRRAEHIYAKHDNVIERMESLDKSSAVSSASHLVESLCRVLYDVPNEDRMRARGLLFSVHHHALHDRFYRARDLYLMSHLQETIQGQDASTQILFNRTMVQLGLCAFRTGLFREAQSCLQDISFNTKIRELLGQGVTMQRYIEKTPEQERQEKLKQLPYHMHIHMELIESVYLISSMLVEIPQLAAEGFDRAKIQSRPFKRLMDYSERQMFSGPPETNRDHLMAAARALSEADGRRCAELLLQLKVWSWVSPDKAVIQRVQATVARRVQEEALRTYLFSYCAYYESLGLAQLAEMFGLPVDTVYRVIIRMILNEELFASLDQPSGTVILHRIEPTQLQQLALQFADKAASLVESNERWLEVHAGVAEPAQPAQQQTGYAGYGGYAGQARRGRGRPMGAPRSFQQNQQQPQQQQQYQFSQQQQQQQQQPFQQYQQNGRPQGRRPYGYQQNTAYGQNSQMMPRTVTTGRR